MSHELQLFIGSFTTLLAVVNPLEATPVFLSLLEGQDRAARRRVALWSCIYAFELMLFFLFFGTLIMKFFGVPLSMVRIAGGIVLTRIGFDLFSPPPGGRPAAIGPDAGEGAGHVAFMPLAMPLMVGPGVIATLVGMAATIEKAHFGVAALFPILCAAAATALLTYLCLIFAEKLSKGLGARGIDAATRIVGFFVSAMGVGLVFDGVIEALQGRIPAAL